MTPERAREIVKAINDRCLFTMELVDKVASLKGVTLEEMIEATRIVEGENHAAAAAGGSYSISLVPDDRLIAAAYCLDHYHTSPEPICLIPHRSLDGDRKALAVVALDSADATEEESADG